MALKIAHVEDRESMQLVRELFLEYAATLGFSLCFQSFDKELAELPGKYAKPSGRLLLAFDENQAVGCAGMRQIGDGVCEMKRLYVKPEFRGTKIGAQLVQLLIEEARKSDYHTMRLDTLPSGMASAVRLYRSFGFREIAPYYDNPIEGALFMELNLI